MILEDGTEIDIGTQWEINVPCIININRSDENFKRWCNPEFVGLDLTKQQAIEMCKQIMNAVDKYDHLEKSLEEYHAKFNTDE